MHAKALVGSRQRHFLAQRALVGAAAGWLLMAADVPNGMAQDAAQLISTRSAALVLPAGGNGDSVDPQISPDGRFVLFNSTAGNLAPNCGGQLCSQVFLRDRTSNTTTLVSVNLLGFGGNGNSSYGAMTPDGRYVVFTSDASDLVAGDTNGFSDVFVRDLLAGTTVLASVSSTGVEGNGSSSHPVMTPDGRYVAFLSTSTNLASGGHDNPDIFLRDLVGQTTLAMSSAATGSPTGAIMASLAISTNGRYVAFVSTALNLVSGVTQAGGEVYVRDFVGGGITWASSNASITAQAILGTNMIPASEHPVMSEDGNWVAFKTGSNSLNSPSAVIFQYNATTAALTTVYTNGIYTAYGDDFCGPEMTPDGRFIVFTSAEQGTTTNGSIRLWDSQAATNEMVSANLSGDYSTNTLAQAASITPDGRYVVFLSDAGDLTLNTVSNGSHIFRCDLQEGVITMVDVDSNGVGSTDFTGTMPDMSTNGQFIAFSGPDGALAPLDINGANDVFVRDATGGTTQMISLRNPSIPTRSGDKVSWDGPLSLSADGRWVAFSSYANDLVPNDTNNARDVFVCDRWSGSNILVSVGQNGGSALGGDSMAPMISTNGRYVVFVSAATNLTAGNVITNPGAYNVYRTDLQTQTTVLVSVSTNGVQSGDNDSISPVMSQDGRYVAYLSEARNLAAGLTGTGTSGTGQSTFWADLNTGTNLAFAGNFFAQFGSTMSANGRYVAYATSTQVFVWDSQQNKNIFTNTDTYEFGNSASISPDGSHLIYGVTLSQEGPVNFKVQDLVHGTNILTVTNVDVHYIQGPGIWSSNGQFVAVVTGASVRMLDEISAKDIYLFNLLTSNQVLVSVNSNHTGDGNAGSDWPAVSGDGRYVVYRSFATNLVAGHTNSPDLYIYDSVAGTNGLLTLEQPASDWMVRSSKPVLSMDISSAVFQSLSSGLVLGHVSGLEDVFAALLPPAADADSDGDGIPDWWMIQYFGHLTGQTFDMSLAQDDPNGTGMTTLQDYIAGTNPTDPNSVFDAAVAPPASLGGQVTLFWPAVAGRSYSIQYKNELTDPVWQALSGTPTINGNRGQFTVPTDQTSRYYRIVVQ